LITTGKPFDRIAIPYVPPEEYDVVVVAERQEGSNSLNCFPAAYGPGIRSHYVISQDGVVYKKDLGHGKGIDVYPADPLKEGWERVD